MKPAQPQTHQQKGALVCNDCQRRLPTGSFSRNQQRKTSLRQCNECIQATSAPPHNHQPSQGGAQAARDGGHFSPPLEHHQRGRAGAGQQTVNTGLVCGVCEQRLPGGSRHQKKKNASRRCKECVSAAPPHGRQPSHAHAQAKEDGGQFFPPLEFTLQEQYARSLPSFKAEVARRAGSLVAVHFVGENCNPTSNKVVACAQILGRRLQSLVLGSEESGEPCRAVSSASVEMLCNLCPNLVRLELRSSHEVDTRHGNTHTRADCTPFALAFCAYI